MAEWTASTQGLNPAGAVASNVWRQAAGGCTSAAAPNAATLAVATTRRASMLRSTISVPAIR